jgi:hypothetical protein
MPEIETVELLMMNAGPGRLLQLNTVADGTPLSTSDTLVIPTEDSWKTPALKFTKEAFMV